MTMERTAPAPPDHADVAFHPPILLALSLATGFLLRAVAPVGLVPDGVAAALGPVVTVAALACFGWSITSMRSGGGSIPTHTPTPAIVTKGPYRFSRNPIYVSMLLLQVGVGIWANSPWFLVLAAVFARVMWWGVISREERYLERKFGAEYTAYKARVRRWL